MRQQCQQGQDLRIWRAVQCYCGLACSNLTRLSLLSLVFLFGCAGPISNKAINPPISQVFLQQAALARAPGSQNMIALSLSGGGMRAAAFAFGVMQELAKEDGTNPAGTVVADDVFEDISFISSVSGGSLTAAYFGLHGRSSYQDFRQHVLAQDLERELRVSLWSPVNLARVLAGGLNDRSNLAHILHREIYGQATFADFYRQRKPEIWINATDLYNRTPFPFIPQVFMALCSDLSQLHVADAVAASMAVPLVFAPIVLKTHPDHCLSPLPDWVNHGLAPQAGQGVVQAMAQSVRNYRNPKRMRYVKLVDGGVTDNNGLSSILIARAVSGTAYGPMEEATAVKARRMLFLVVDAGRPPTGEWAKQEDGPSGVDVALAAADTAIDSATRLGADAFVRMTQSWHQELIRYRCSLDAAKLAQLAVPQDWKCADLQLEVGVIGFDNLDAVRAERLKNMPTRLSLPAKDIDAAIAAGRDAAKANPALARYRAARGR